VAPKTGPVPTSLLGPLKWVGLGIASLIFLFFMTRALRKREGEALARPAWLTEIEEPVRLSELEERTQILDGPATITLPPPTPRRPLKAPPAVPIAASFRVREAIGMAGDTRGG